VFQGCSSLLDKKMATRYREAVFISPDAGVVKLVDAGDSKSPGLNVHVGSIPTSGTIFFSTLWHLFISASPSRIVDCNHFVTVSLSEPG
jgi:hypothetical protein